jgi:GT2 family glycosyltransferase
MIKREITDSVGLFDESLPIGFEDVDLALRIKKKGFRVVVATAAKVFHDVPMARDIHITEGRAYWRGRNRIVFYKKYAAIRCLFAFIDVVGFLILLLKINQSPGKHVLQYLRGVRNGLAHRPSH